jgi:hypothetical protein
MVIFHSYVKLLNEIFNGDNAYDHEVFHGDLMRYGDIMIYIYIYSLANMMIMRMIWYHWDILMFSFL